jgi:hypothetical protein
MTTRGLSAPCLVTTTNRESTRALEEVRARLEAVAANSANALLGRLDSASVHEGNVRLAERAALYLRIAS